MKLLTTCVLTLILFQTSSLIFAQTCPVVEPIVMADSCSELERGQLCLDKQTSSLHDQSTFEVKSSAVAKIQANYTDVETQKFVSLIFIGHLQVTNKASLSQATLPIRVPINVNTSGQKVNIRALPLRSGKVVVSIDDKTDLVAIGQSRDQAWIQVLIPNTPDQVGWVSTQVIHSDYDLKMLTTAKPDDPIPNYPEFTPMQSFSLQSDDPCAGVIIQPTQKHADIQINDVKLTLNDATVFVQVNKQQMDINVLVGVVKVETKQGVTVVPAGAFTEVSLNPQATVTPSPANGYDMALTSRLNGNYSTQQITAAPPATQDEIKTALLVPLSGKWNVPYYKGTVSGTQCPANGESGYSLAGTLPITVAEDGHSFSWPNSGGISTAVQTSAGNYIFSGIPYTVISPTEIHVGPYTMGTWEGLDCRSTAQFTMTYLGE